MTYFLLALVQPYILGIILKFINVHDLHRLAEDRGDRPKGSGPTQFRPLYDIPFMFEAREFLRKKLIGQNVQITVDYIQEANNDFPEKTCCTVTIGMHYNFAYSN